MTSVNVTTTKNTVTVNGETRVVTVKTVGPQGAQGVLQTGDLGDITVTTSGSGTQSVAINTDAVTSAKILDGTIVNADINASAAIAGTKINPNFGSQNIITSGGITTNGVFIIESVFPRIRLVDSDNDSDYDIRNANGQFTITDQTNTQRRFQINNSGGFQFGNGSAASNVDITGNLTIAGTVDGVDIATRDTLFGALTSSSGVLSNGVTATTQAQSDNSTKVSTTAYVRTAISNLVDSSPDALNTLNELAAALNDDASFSTTVTNSIATKLPLAGGTLTGNLTINTTAPLITFNESDTNKIFNLVLDGSALSIRKDSNAGSNIVQRWNSDGHIDFLTNVDISGLLTVTNDLILTDQNPSLFFTETGNVDPDYKIFLNQGVFRITDETNSADRFVINTDGHIDFPTNVDFAGNITLPDNGKIILGTGGETDSFISFDGTHLQIRETSAAGALRLDGHNIFLRNPTQSDETYLKCNGQSTNRNVELYCEGTQRLETTSTGIKVDRIVTIDGSTPRIEMKPTADEQSHRIEFYNAADSIVSRIYGHPSGDLELQTGASGNETAIKVNSNGAVDLHFDGGTYSTAKLSTTSTGVDINGVLDVEGSGSSTSPSILANTTNTGSFIHAMHLLSPNIQSTQSNILVLGKSKNTKNSAFLGYKYSSANSNDNLFTINMWGPHELLTINGEGNTTIAGDLAVDTDTLFVDSTNDKVGINQASPEGALDVNGQIRSFSTTGTSASGLKVSSANENVHLYLQNGNSNAVFNISYGGSGGNDIAITHDGIVKLFNGGGTTPKLATSATGVNVTGDVVATGHLRNSVPTDFWNSGSYFEVGDLGHISTHGGFEFTLTSGGYRRQVSGQGKWKDITVDGQSGFGCQVALAPKTGKIHFRSNSGLSTDDNNPSNAGLTDRLVVDQGGITVSGGIGLSGALLVGNEINMFNGTTNSHRFIDCGLGDNNDLRIRGCSGGDANHENMIVATRGSSVRLHHDGATTAKLETTATGVQVNGNLDIDTGTLIIDTTPNSPNINFGLQEAIRIDDAGNTVDRGLNIYEYRQGGGRFFTLNFNLASSSTGSAYQYTQGNYGSSSMIRFDGLIKFYVNPANDPNQNVITPTKRFEINTTGAALPDNAQLHLGNEGDLKIYHDSQNSYIQETGEGNLFIDSSFFTLRDGGGSDIVATFTDGTGSAGGCRLFHGGASTAKLATTATGVSIDGSAAINNAITLTGAEGDIEATGATGLTLNASNANAYARIRVAGNTRLYIKNDGKIGIGNENPSSDLDVSGNANITGTLETKAIRFGGSHVKRISVDYTGEDSGDGENYLVDDEFQEILTITPGGNYRNYTIIGRIFAQDGSLTHTVDLSMTLRVNQRPDMGIAGTYVSTIAGGYEYLTPRFWLDETTATTNHNGTTGKFKLAVEINRKIHGRVTADLEIITRNEADLDHVVVNEDETSEVTSVPSGYTQTTPIKVYETDDGAFSFDSSLTVGGTLNANGTIDFSSSSSFPNISLKNSHNRNKINLFAGFNHQIGTETVSYGGLSSSAITFQAPDNDSQGFIFTKAGNPSSKGAMAITSNGKATIAHSLRLGHGDDDTTTPGATHALDVSGSIASTSTITCTSLTETSDIALKENIQPLSNVLDKVKQLTGYKYNFKNKDKSSMGVIAQDVEKVFPELVHGEEGKKSLQYSGLVGALIEAVKELSAKVAVLESK